MLEVPSSVKFLEFRESLKMMFFLGKKKSLSYYITIPS